MHDHESFLALYNWMRRVVRALLVGCLWVVSLGTLVFALAHWIVHGDDPTEGAAWFIVLLLAFCTGVITLTLEEWLPKPSRLATLRLAPAAMQSSAVALLALFVPDRAPRGEHVALAVEALAAFGYLGLVLRSFRRDCSRAEVELPHAAVRKPR